MIAILNAGLANASSVLFAIERLGYQANLTQDADVIACSSRVILPGVGTANALMQFLGRHELIDCLTRLKQPVLGICLGMQILYEFSQEGEVKSLGILEGKVERLKGSARFPVPHMGWNQIKELQDCSLLRGIPHDSYFYFIHSFRAPWGAETNAVTEYTEQFPAVIEHSHWFGTQFHPEKSGSVGEKLLKNFLNL